MTMTATNIKPQPITSFTSIPLTNIPAITSFTSTFISQNSYDDYDCDGASKCCFLLDEEEDFVLKFPQEDEENYCQIEADIYKKVPEELKKFFAKTFYLGKFTDREGEVCGVYYQERVPVIAESKLDCYAFGDDIYDWAKEIEIDCDGGFLLYLLSKGYSEEICQKLQNFIHLQGINDLHDGNWGLREDGTPVLFDFSGYDG